MTATKDVQAAIHRSNASMQAVAEGIGKETSTLYGELNGNRGKLGLEDALNILRTLGDVEPHRKWVAEHGYSLVRLDASGTRSGDLPTEVLDVGSAFGCLSGLVRTALADGKITESERQDLLQACMALLREVGDALAAIGGPREAR